MPLPEDQPLHQPTTSRESVSRINRSYFQQRSSFQKTRRWLILAAVAIGVGWCAWGAIDVPRHYSPGAVASPHAKWENDCKACHVPLTPIKDATWLTTAETRREADAKCEACHRGAVHHPLQIASEAGSCASCHTDHRGRMNDLTRVSDQTCTACHASIAKHRVAKDDVPSTSNTMPITRFDNEHHPPFASITTDPGSLKFSHGRHMRAGLTFGPTGAETIDAATSPATRGTAKVWTYDMLPPADRRRYLPADGRETDAIQLSCSSCHEFGTTVPPGDTRLVSGRLAASPPGAYSLPVEFDRHCAACHVLPYEGAAIGSPVAAVVPHGLDAAALRRFLESAVLERMAAHEPRLLDRQPAPQDPLPAVPAAAPANPTVRALVIDRVAKAQTFVRGTCEKCHAVQPAPVAPDRGLLGPAASLDSGWFLVTPTRIPQIWFAKANFNHQPHRGYDCRICHAAAYPDDASTGLPAGSPPA